VINSRWNLLKNCPIFINFFAVWIFLGQEDNNYQNIFDFFFHKIINLFWLLSSRKHHRHKQTRSEFAKADVVLWPVQESNMLIMTIWPLRGECLTMFLELMKRYPKSAVLRQENSDWIATSCCTGTNFGRISPFTKTDVNPSLNSCRYTQTPASV